MALLTKAVPSAAVRLPAVFEMFGDRPAPLVGDIKWLPVVDDDRRTNKHLIHMRNDRFRGRHGRLRSP